MRQRQKRAAFFGAGLACLLASAPAHAWPFDHTEPQKKPALVSDQTVEQIQKAFDDTRYLDAAKMLDQALLTGVDDPRLVYLTGELNLARGRYDDALANFKKIDADAKLRARALEGEGITLAQLGRGSDAIVALEAAVTQDPSVWRAWNALGTEYDRHHDWAKAEAAYDHAMSGSDSAAIVLNNRGFSRLSQNRLDEAAVDFVAALQKKPDLTSARNNLRLVLAMKGDYDRAVSGAAPTDRAAALNNAGFAAMLQGDYGKAKDLFNQAMKARGEYYAVAAANLEMTQGLEAGHAGAAGADHAAAH